MVSLAALMGETATRKLEPKTIVHIGRCQVCGQRVAKAPLCCSCAPRGRDKDDYDPCEHCKWTDRCREKVAQGMPVLCEQPDLNDISRAVDVHVWSVSVAVFLWVALLNLPGSEHLTEPQGDWVLTFSQDVLQLIPEQLQTTSTEDNDGNQ
jgi:hypothetical protein